MRTLKRTGLPSLLLCLLFTSPAWAWHEEGHFYAALAATKALPDDMPAYFRKGGHAIGHVALDPDVVKSPDLKQLRSFESPEHFIDLELLRGRRLPQTRYDFLALCRKLHEKPQYVGMLPYSITEWTQRLTMAFAEYRQHPDNPYIRMKSLVYAGYVAHYAADLEQPLHTTIDFDGRANAKGRSPHSGIHSRVDALPTKLPYDVLFAAGVPSPESHRDVFAYVKVELDRSHALVGRVYELASKIPAAKEMTIKSADVRAFTIDRMRASAHFVASLFLSAWRDSAHIQPPDWLDRDQYDTHFDPAHVPGEHQENRGE